LNQDETREWLRELARRFSADPDTVRKRLAEFLAADPIGFRGAALGVLAELDDPVARKALLELMLKGGVVPVCDPALMGIEEELALTRDLFELDPSLDMKLARRLPGNPAGTVRDEVVQRVLVLLHSIPENPRILPMVIKLLRHPSPNVRSKAALVIGRVSKTPQLIEGLLSEPDPRMRANAVESLWGMDSAGVRAVLLEAAEDPNNRVVGNALLGLYGLGDTGAILRILRMAAHPKAEFRATAAWAMARTGNPRFLPALAQMVREGDRTARTWVFRAIAKLKQTASEAAALASLRVHLSGASFPAGGTCTVSAAIAAEDGRDIPKLPATSILLWEGSHIVADYSVRQTARPESLTLGLVLPLGEAGDRVAASLSALKRPLDRWLESRYSAVGVPGALEQAFAFLAPPSANRYMIFLAPPPSSGPNDASQWSSVRARGRAISVSLHIVSDTCGDPGAVATACEKAYLTWLCGYEITSRERDGTARPPELKLEVYAGQRYGADVLKTAVPDLLPAA